MEENGVIQNWNDAKGYGFIRPDNGVGDVFLHRKELRGGGMLFTGDRMTFVCEARTSGLYAVEARRN